jgi:hypothetical protein
MYLSILRMRISLPRHTREVSNSQAFVKEGISGEVANLSRKRQVELPTFGFTRYTKENSPPSTWTKLRFALTHSWINPNLS